MCKLRGACFIIKQPGKLEWPSGELVVKQVNKRQCLATGQSREPDGHFSYDRMQHLNVSSQRCFQNKQRMCHLSLNHLTSKIIRCQAEMWRLGHLGQTQGKGCSMTALDGFWLAAFVALPLGGFFTSQCCLPVTGVFPDANRGMIIWHLVGHSVSTVQTIPRIWDK